MKKYTSKKKEGRGKTKPAKSYRQSMRASLAAAIAPLHTVTRAKLAIDLALTRTAIIVTKQVAILFSEASQRTAESITRNQMDEAERDLQEAIDELDRAEPFGGKAGFGKGADFPRVCWEGWKSVMSQVAQRYRRVQQARLAEGDSPAEAHRKAVDAIRDTVRAASESYSRCLRQPIRKRVTPTGGE